MESHEREDQDSMMRAGRKRGDSIQYVAYRLHLWEIIQSQSQNNPACRLTPGRSLHDFRFRYCSDGHQYTLPHNWPSGYPTSPTQHQMSVAPVICKNHLVDNMSMPTVVVLSQGIPIHRSFQDDIGQANDSQVVPSWNQSNLINKPGLHKVVCILYLNITSQNYFPHQDLSDT
jgi:hypothetical protein